MVCPCNLFGNLSFGEPIISKKDKTVHPVKVDTKDNLANVLTKQEPGLRESAVQLRKITGPPA